MIGMTRDGARRLARLARLSRSWLRWSPSDRALVSWSGSLNRPEKHCVAAGSGWDVSVEDRIGAAENDALDALMAWSAAIPAADHAGFTGLAVFADAQDVLVAAAARLSALQVSV